MHVLAIIRLGAGTKRNNTNIPREREREISEKVTSVLHLRTTVEAEEMTLENVGCHWQNASG